jgi:surface protein
MELVFYNCCNLTSIGDLSNWQVGNVTNMRDMFWECHSLESLNLSNWDTSNVTTISGMFDSCESLTSLNVSNWDTSNVTDMSWLFEQCYSLETIIGLDTWDVSNVTDMNGMFVDCTALTDFEAPKNISTDISFQYCTALSHDSLMSIINNLATVTSTQTITISRASFTKIMNDGCIAAAGDRGWSLSIN